jgi:outer membrane protein TolC
MKKAALSLLLASAALVRPALAQQTPPPAAPAARPVPPVKRGPTLPSTTPAAPGAPTAAALPAPPEPKLPEVDDPMLAPPPAPTHQLSSWKQGVSLIRQRNNSLKQSLATVEVANARARQALSASLPILSARAGIQREMLRGEGTGTEIGYDGAGVLQQRTYPRDLPSHSLSGAASLSLRVPVFAPRAWYDHDTRKQEAEAAKLDIKEIERQLVAGVADLIVNAVTAERLAEVSRVSLRSVLSTLDLNKRRAALGASSALDVLRIEQEVQLARAQVVSADENLIRAREALGIALGDPEDWGVTQDLKLDALSSDTRTSCIQVRGVESRSDVRAAAAEVSIAERGAGSADRSFWPTIDLLSDLTYYPRSEASPTNLNFSWTIGAQLNWVIYDGGLRYGQKDESEASTRIAKARLDDVTKQARLQVTQALRSVKVAEASLAVSSRTREVSAETDRLARVAFLNGSGTTFDLVDNARRLREAEIDLTIKEFEVLRARIAALLALSSCKV